jgi:hypothetical protein
MDKDILNIVENTDFDGYIIVDWDSVFGKTTCPNKAVSMALERSRTGGEGLSEFVKVFSVGAMGKYAKVPGERYAEEYNWNRASMELMG